MFTTMTAKRLMLLSAALGAMTQAGAAAAQTQAAAPAQAVDEVDEIIVTAQRRSENIQTAPLSVAAVSGEEMRGFQAGGEDILALSGRVPGLYAETTTGRIFPRFYIRGLGNIDFYLGASQPVSIIQDDVVLEHVVMKSNPMFDIRQIEVLRGPQGSLFGRNTTAGIIKFDTIRPSLEASARASLSYGERNTVVADMGVGGPIVADVLAARASLFLQRRDDYIDNTFTGQDDVMGGYSDANARLQLLYTPTEAFSLLGAFHARDYEGTSTLFRRNGLTQGSNEINDSVEWDEVQNDGGNNNPQAYETFGGSLRGEYDFGGVKATLISAYETLDGFSRGDTDGGAATVAPGESEGRVADLDQWSHEFRLASDGEGPLDWQVGAYHFRSTDITEFYQRTYLLGTDLDNWVRLENSNETSAVFGQVSYAVTPTLKLTAGARYTEDTKETRLLKARSTYSQRRFVELTGEEPSWDVSAFYQIQPELGVYARIARGFRGPTIQGRSAVFNADFTTADSETILSYEVGFKSQLFDRTLRLNAAAYTYTVEDIQLNANDSNGNGVLFNADEAQAYGLEADAEWRPIENLVFTGGLSLIHSEINDANALAQVCSLNTVPTNPTNTVVCTVNDPTITIGRNTFARIDGNPLPNAPEYTVDFTARYAWPLGDQGELFVHTDWNMQGFTNYVLYETEEFNSDGNFEGGLKIGYSRYDGAYELALFARNITDEMNLKGVIENHMAAVINEPRVIGVSFSARLP